MKRKMTSSRIASGILEYAKKYDAGFNKSSLYRVVSQNTETFGDEDAKIIDVLIGLKKQRGNEYLYIIDGTIDELINEEHTYMILVEMIEG